MRGERPGKRLQPFVDTGSSPHARGTRTTARGWTGRRRFIPACAGNALALEVTAWRYSVHPRMRGERLASPRYRMSMYGSSPHARGTHLKRDRPLHEARFIPACAGNAALNAAFRARNSVHPRMRGERQSKGGDASLSHGSSPHARGTPPRPSVSVMYCAVHPRMRGERRNNLKGKIMARGSSPHARGTHHPLYA